MIGGGAGEVHPEVYKVRLALGDTLLFCTDGLTGGVSDAEVTRLLGAPGTAAETCRHLVDAAKAAGGRDNITVVVAHFRDGQQAEALAAKQAAAVAEPAQALAEAAPAALASA